MIGAHTPAGGAVVRVHDRACVRARGRSRSSEAGFSLIELLIVLIIVAILLVVALPNLSERRQKDGAPQVNLAAAAIWRGVQQYRLENAGAFPPYSMLQNAGANFKNPGNGRYIERWPEDTRGGPMTVLQGSGGTPTGTGSAAQRGQVVYFANGTTGWLVGYGESGVIVYRREVGTWGAPPLG